MGLTGAGGGGDVYPRGRRRRDAQARQGRRLVAPVRVRIIANARAAHCRTQFTSPVPVPSASLQDQGRDPRRRGAGQGRRERRLGRAFPGRHGPREVRGSARLDAPLLLMSRPCAPTLTPIIPDDPPQLRAQPQGVARGPQPQGADSEGVVYHDPA